MNILIIDDDGDDRDLFCETLKDLIPSANCIIQENGEAALRYLLATTHIPDYIFLDIFMGGIDGKECLLKIQTIKALQRIPIIMYSGFVDSNQIAVYKTLGASEVISKPTSIDALRNILASIIK